MPYYSQTQRYYLAQLGLECFQKVQSTTAVSQVSLQQLAEQVSACQRCGLAAERTQTVFARGNPKASVLIVGEAPGFHEDKQGRPFVGRAGALLDNMLKSIGLGEQDVYIVNVLKCRPANNRDPSAEEIAHCSPYLQEQIALIKPRIILALGRFAGQFLSQSKQSMAELRKQPCQYQGIPVNISYHPAYLLRNLAEKKAALLDLHRFRAALDALQPAYEG